MSRSTFAAIAALVSLVNAIPAFVVPDALASLYGVILDRQTLLLGQTLAASYLGYAVINWMTRDGSELSSRRGIAAGNLVAWAIGGVLWTYAASTGLTNAVGWIVVGLSVVFSLGWAYFTFADRGIEGRTTIASATR
ncbi:MAG: hypothetical protein E6H91_06435 [Chloroflexi bacterium]|nr:MAG: hypothetical protein E6H91_06435 [Chloroflexota bacterium]